MNTPAPETQTLYFAAHNGHVMTRDDANPLGSVRAYVMRGNAHAARRGDDSRPYAVLKYVVPVSVR